MSNKRPSSRDPQAKVCVSAPFGTTQALGPVPPPAPGSDVMRTHFQTFWPAVPPVGTPAPGAVAPPTLVLYGAAQLVVVLKPVGI